MELVQKCIRGGEAAWAELIALHGETMRRAVSRALARGGRAGPEETHDVYQGLLVALLDEGRRRLKTYRGECSLKGWLVAVATRFALDHLRRLKVRKTVPLPDVEEKASGNTSEISLEAARVKKAMQELSDTDALVLRLFHIEGLPYNVIAKTVGMPLNTLCSRIARARTRLRGILGTSLH